MKDFTGDFTETIKNPYKFINELHRKLEGLYNDLEEVGAGTYINQHSQSAQMIRTILEWMEGYRN